MMMMYATGYPPNVRMRTRTELRAWSHWQNLDEEMARRLLALLDASIVAGRPVGVGSIFRSAAAQRSLFLERHTVSSSGGCCSFEGKRWALKPGAAHAAPPGLSYHEGTTPLGKALAADLTGDLRFVAQHCAVHGLREFEHVNNEPWHVQPLDVPSGRRSYVPDRHHPLGRWDLPGDFPPPDPQPVEEIDMRFTLLTVVYPADGVGIVYICAENAGTKSWVQHGDADDRLRARINAANTARPGSASLTETTTADPAVIQSFGPLDPVSRDALIDAGYLVDAWGMPR